MVRSLVVILGFVALLIAIVPRVSSVDQPGVDAVRKASFVVADTGLPLLVMTEVPAGWKSVTATYTTDDAGIATWQVNYLTPDGGAVAIRQAAEVDERWMAAATAEGARQGEEMLAGRQVERWWSVDKDRLSFVDRGGEGAGLVTVVTGTAPEADIALVFTRLAPPPELP